MTQAGGLPGWKETFGKVLVGCKVDRTQPSALVPNEDKRTVGYMNRRTAR